MKVGRAIYFVSLLALTILSTQALTPSERSAIRTALESAKAAELPEVAEELIRDATSADRAETAKIIFEYVIAKRAATVRPVFASLLKIYPDTFLTVSHAHHGAMAAHEALAPDLQRIPVRQTRPGNVTSPPTPPLPIPGGNITSYGGSASSSGMVRGGIIVRGGIPFPRGSAVLPTTANVTQSNTPINTTSGGNGNGSFTGAAAIPAIPGPCLDYSQPRH